MGDRIPIYAPDIGELEREYVLDCLDSTWISSKGGYVARFEDEFAAFVGASHAATVSNGTVALHVALLALGIGPGDEVIVPTLTYIASANAVTYTGATPVFCDCDPLDWQMTADTIRPRITPRTKAIMPVHLYGAACDMGAIGALAREHGLRIVEDCAEAIGSTIGGRPVGTFGEIAAFSFFGNKTITTGEGGMVVTNDPALHERAVRIKGQGLAAGQQYWHDILGYNYRMTNICAAIGVAQLQRADAFITRKRAIFDRYRANLAGLPLAFQPEAPGTRNSRWMIAFTVPEARQRDPLRAWLEARGIETRPLFFPIHTMPMYGEPHGAYPIAEDIAARGINVPSWPGLDDAQVDAICDAIRGFFAGHSRD